MSSQLNLTQVGPIVVPVTDQEAALAFYIDVLGMQKTNDATYDTGERWLEVSPSPGSASLCLVLARPERPAGIETGVILMSTDVLADLGTLKDAGARTDETPLEPGTLVWWSGAPLAGFPTQFRLYDPDGNSFLIVSTS